MAKLTDRSTLSIGLAAASVVAALTVAGVFWSTSSEAAVERATITATLVSTTEATSRNERTIQRARDESRLGREAVGGRLVRIETKLDRLIERLSGGG